MVVESTLKSWSQCPSVHPSTKKSCFDFNEIWCR